MRSEDSEMFLPPSKVLSPAESAGVASSTTKPKTPFLNVRQETASTESKDTLTPLENCDDRTLVGEGSAEDIVDPNYDGLRQRAVGRRRSSTMVGGGPRRNSESTSGFDINKSQSSLHQMGFAKRQHSMTQSEPDSGNEQRKLI